MRKKHDYNSNNICLFPPQQHDSDEGLGVINVTYENNWQKPINSLREQCLNFALLQGVKAFFAL